MPRMSHWAVVMLIGAATLPASGAEAVHVAGMQPDRRPAGAPVMRSSDRDRSAERQFRGVAKPYPKSLRFAANHGGWFTPFTEPGMTGPYDLRAYHQSPANPRSSGKGGG